LTPEQRAGRGEAARERVVREFDEKIVVERYLDVVKGILGEPRG